MKNFALWKEKIPLFFGLPRWAFGKESFVVSDARPPPPSQSIREVFWYEMEQLAFLLSHGEFFNERTHLTAGWHKQAMSLYSDKGK